MTSTEEQEIYYYVPYSEKDYVKALGCKWDVQRKLWHINANHMNKSIMSNCFRTITINPKIVKQDHEISKNNSIQYHVNLNAELDELNRRYDLYDKDKKHKIIFEETDFNHMVYLRNMKQNKII